MFKVALIHPDAKPPTRKFLGDAGHDLHSCENVVIPPNTRQLVSTGIKIQIPNDCYARIAPRSGLAVNYIDVGAGVVDSSYFGTLKVLIINNSYNPFTISIGDRIAQLVLEKIYNTTFEQVVESELTQTHRGEGGFGSTGTK